MTVLNKILRVYAPLGISLVSLAIVGGLIIYKDNVLGARTIVNTTLRPTVLGKSILLPQATLPPQQQKQIPLGTVVSPLGAPESTVNISDIPTSRVLPTSGAQFQIVLVDGPGELVDGYPATFTWYISGAPGITHTSTVYFGMTSTPGNLSEDISPGQTNYSGRVGDFIQGEYVLPIRFVGNSEPLKQGTYYYRAYAYINNKHYWTDERMFIVSAPAVNTIKVVSFPETVVKGENAAFTWEIIGPANSTNFTAIVAGKDSKPGPLDVSTDISKTPYSVLVKDFISGTYNIPIRLVGNALLPEEGKYYFRALTFINGKNIWSDEYSLVVQ